MCSESERPSTSAFARNLQADMPLARKVRLVLTNTLRKILRLRSCCGHPGEPGC